MFCRNCGKELPEGAKFCNECGTPVTPEGLEKQAEQEKLDKSVETPATFPSEGTPSKNKFKKGIILAIIIAAALIVVIVVAVRIHSNNGGDEYADDTSVVSINDTDVDEIYTQYIEPFNVMAGRVCELKSDGFDPSDDYEIDSDMLKSFKKAFATSEAIPVSVDEVYNYVSWEVGSILVDLNAWDDSGNLVVEIMGDSELGVVLNDGYSDDCYIIASEKAIAAFADLENEILEKYYENIESEKAALTANVMITDLEVAPIQVQSIGDLDSLALPVLNERDTTKEYVISMVISNENDVSCDIAPSLKATVEVADHYGDYKVEEITDISAETPYRSFASAIDGYLAPVGLAPHETKTVYYYLEYIWTDTAGCVYFDDYDVQMRDVELLDFVVEEAQCEYLPVNEWGNAVTIETEIQSHYTGDLALGSVAGSIQNNTGVKWESVTVQYAFQINGSDYGGYDSQSFYYINIDEAINLKDDEYYTFNYYLDRFITQVDVIPTLLGYIPDEE